MGRGARCSGGSAVLSVLVLLVIGVLVAASVLVGADAAATTSRAAQERVQSRALAWSGVQGVMAELAAQRDDLLRGAAPEVTPEWTLFDREDGVLAVVRLIDLDPERESFLVSESAKVDVNRAPAEVLALVPGLDASLAGAIVAARAGGPFTSLGQLLGVEGIGPSTLHGSPGAGPEGAAASPVGVPGPGEGGGLDRYLTVFAFDPNVQVGFGGAEEHFGRLRVNLNREWSAALGEAIADRFDQNVAGAVRGAMSSGAGFDSDARLVEALIDLGAMPEDWGPVLDAFTTTDDEFLLGRIDVNLAEPEVLACLPGVTAELAEAIAERRTTLGPSQRLLAHWLVTEGLLSEAEYANVADLVTTRSMQWRVRLEVGLERVEEGWTDPEDAVPVSMEELLRGWDDAEAGPGLEYRMVVEAVIDVGSTRPRVAYMREVTMLDRVLAMVEAEAAEADTDAGRDLGEPSAEPDASGDLGMASDPGFGAEMDFGPEMGFGDLGFGEDLDFGGPPGGEADAPGSRGADGENGGEGEADSGPVDRRIGRWTTRRASGS